VTTAEHYQHGQEEAEKFAGDGARLACWLRCA